MIHKKVKTRVSYKIYNCKNKDFNPKTVIYHGPITLDHCKTRDQVCKVEKETSDNQNCC